MRRMLIAGDGVLVGSTAGTITVPGGSAGSCSVTTFRRTGVTETPGSRDASISSAADADADVEAPALIAGAVVMWCTMRSARGLSRETWDFPLSRLTAAESEAAISVGLSKISMVSV